ncbi:hypothetical protein EOA35_37285 [Mesorhizobium sp. M8A.F.Ca.ET.023.01.1.1]|nr:hypothetical protein EOA35_37285 [Mesorhizobium sp. M8A.F.Ca.ET.023.01.1.1]
MTDGSISGAFSLREIVDKIGGFLRFLGYCGAIDEHIQQDRTNQSSLASNAARSSPFRHRDPPHLRC